MTAFSVVSPANMNLTMKADLCCMQTCTTSLCSPNSIPAVLALAAAIDIGTFMHLFLQVFI